MKKESTVECAMNILSKKKTSLDIYTLFKEVAKEVEIAEEKYYDRLSQFHTHLTMDGRFIILADGTWDLRTNHPFEAVNIVTTDFDLDIDDEIDTSFEEEEDYEGMEVTVVKDKEEEEKEIDQIKNIIGIVQEG